MSGAGIGARGRERDQFLAAVRRAPQLMGIVNVTPDSFSDGGRYADPASAVAHAKALAAEGAAIVDIGGESTRPGHAPVSAEDELRRIAPVIAAVAGELDVPVSVDTMKAEVAREAARLGASVINDVWGLQRDPAMADVVAETGCAVVVMHNRDEADASIDILDDLERFFERSLVRAARAGVPFTRILIDPGVGFGKTPEQNHACIANLERLRRFGPPVLVGLSRKSFIGRIIGGAPEERLIGTLSADTVALMNGAAVLRVHDVAEHRQALAVFSTLAAARRPTPQRTADPRADVALALGGNVGDKVAALRRALAALAAEPGVELAAVSRFFRTPPWGKTDQDWFVNACVLVHTDLAPEALLDRVKAIETTIGRTPAERWGPRLIDIDIIAYDDLALATDRLTLPHPQAFNRAFVLIPLADIAPDRVIGGRRVGEAAARLGADAEGVVPID
jgi:dihydropteroate synthase